MVATNRKYIYIKWRLSTVKYETEKNNGWRYLFTLSTQSLNQRRFIEINDFGNVKIYAVVIVPNRDKRHVWRRVTRYTRQNISLAYEVIEWSLDWKTIIWVIVSVATNQ